MTTPILPAAIEIDAGGRTFATGLLLDLIGALARVQAGHLIAVRTRQQSAVDKGALEADLDRWSRLTGHSIVGRTEEAGAIRWVIRRGARPDGSDSPGEPLGEPLGSRLWLYVNFDCNLRCDYCCVRSSPTAARRALGIERVRRIAEEAPPLGVRRFFVTGGEPFLLDDIDEILSTLAAAAPVMVLTNGMLFGGPRLRALRRLPRERVTVQISVDSPDPHLHDEHRGRGAWRRAMEGVHTARAEGFRVRLAATVATEADAAHFREFLDREGIAPADRVIRRVALRGSAKEGMALSRADLVPEITITAEGVYWHPVGAEDEDLLVTRDLFPLATAFDAVREHVARETAHARRLASVFVCA